MSRRHRHESTGAEMTPAIDPMKVLADQIDALAEDGYRRRRPADVPRITAAVRDPARTDRKAVPPRRRRSPFVLTAVAGAVAAVVAAGAIALPIGTSGNERFYGPMRGAPGHVMDARSILLGSASVAESRPAVAHGSYWYSQLREVERARQPGKGGKARGMSANGAPRSGPYYPFHAYVSITWENWDPYRQGQTSRTVDRDITTSFATPADKAAWQRAGSPSLTDMKPFTADSHFNEPFLELGPKGTKMADLAKLPDTPTGLLKLIRADRNRRLGQLGKDHAEGQEPSYLQDVIDTAIGVITSPTTPKVRAAAYRVLAAQKGIRSLGLVRDGLGRPGVALAFHDDTRAMPGVDRGETHLIVDPGSGEVLASELYPIGKDGRADREPSSSQLMISSGWVDRLGVRARG